MQGLSQGLEDIACLATLLDTAASPTDILSIYKDVESIRKPRVQKVMSAARNNSKMFSLPPGDARDARNAAWKNWIPDDQLMEVYESAPADPNADGSDLNYIKWVMSYDVVKAVSVSQL